MSVEVARVTRQHLAVELLAVTCIPADAAAAPSAIILLLFFLMGPHCWTFLSQVAQYRTVKQSSIRMKSRRLRLRLAKLVWRRFAFMTDGWPGD